jgi:hypothetical protein
MAIAEVTEVEESWMRYLEAILICAWTACLCAQTQGVQANGNIIGVTSRNEFGDGRWRATLSVPYGTYALQWFN